MPEGEPALSERRYALVGKLLGLRAAIAVVEALSICGVVPDSGAALVAALRSGDDGSDWLLRPSSIHDAHAMIAAVLPLPLRNELLICHPFNGLEAAGDDGFRACLEDMLSAVASHCALIKLIRPDGHWILGRYAMGSYSFIDPADHNLRTGIKSLCEEIGALDAPQFWLTRRENVILFQTTNAAGRT